MARQQKKGFTIIEVVLVLAIAGLIFLMVFIALPALQRSQRNQQRKNDVDRVYVGIINYQKNNKNKPPCKSYGSRYGCTFDTEFIPRYVDNNCNFTESDTVYHYEGCGDEFTDPDGTIYTLYVTDVVYNGYIKNDQTVLASIIEHGGFEEYYYGEDKDEAAAFEKNPTILADEEFYDYNQVLDHAIYLAFGYGCSTLEGKIYPTSKPYDFIVAKELEGGSWYCHGSTSSTSNEHGYEYNIKPDLNVRVR